MRASSAAQPSRSRMQRGRTTIMLNGCSFVGMAGGWLNDVMLFAIPGTLALLTTECESYAALVDRDQSHMPFAAEAVGAIDARSLSHRSHPLLATGCESFATPDSAGSHWNLGGVWTEYSDPELERCPILDTFHAKEPSGRSSSSRGWSGSLPRRLRTPRSCSRRRRSSTC